MATGAFINVPNLFIVRLLLIRYKTKFALDSSGFVLFLFFFFILLKEMLPYRAEPNLHDKLNLAHWCRSTYISFHERYTVQIGGF